MTEAEVLDQFERCSNWGRWGEDDERGTLNLVTQQVTTAALATVQTGRLVSFGKDVPTSSESLPHPALHLMTSVGHDSISSQDALLVRTHGFEHTHMDAVGHTFFDGKMYNGRLARDHVTERGLTFGCIKAMAEGIVTRGVLLDVPSVRGLDYLPSGDGVSAADLDAAAAMAEVNIRSGDAIFVRTGHDARIRRNGPEADDLREGLLADVMPWMHQKEVAVYGGDCIERLPSGYLRVPQPLHQIGHVAMGLAILDIPDMERLLEACREHGRNEFVLVLAPLRVPGGTGCAINPLAIF
jgi:hypothetical protein